MPQSTVIGRSLDPVSDTVKPTLPGPLPPSTSVMLMIGSNPSLSSMTTKAEAWMPARIPGGSVPKPSLTLSPPSTSRSSIAVTVTLCLVSPDAKTRLAGDTE